MFEIGNKLTSRAEELFREQQKDIYVNTDRLFAKFMFWQWLAGIAMALAISPYTWAGQSRAIHIHVWASVFLGSAITFFPIWMTRAWPGAAITRHVIAVAQMLMSALLISITGGRIETHFHVFGSLVILSFYRDWRVLIPATIVVGLDHFIRGVYWPYSVYGVLSATPWRSVEHAAWVAFEDVFLWISCRRSIYEMRSIANRTAALEVSEQSFRRIFDEAPIGVGVVNADYHFVKVNGAMCKMVGYSAKELTQLRSLDITLPEDVELTRQTGERLMNSASGCSFEKRYVRKDKEVIWVHCTVHPIELEQKGSRYYLGMVQDVTERKRAEEEIQKLNQSLELRVQERTAELLAAEERYRMLFERNPEPMWVFDRETLAFLEVNQAAVNHYGYSREEFLRMTIKQIRPPQDVAPLLDHLNHAYGHRVSTRLTRHCKKDDTIIDVVITADDFEWNGRAARLVLAIDITERKRADEALRRAEQKYRSIFENAIEGIFQTTPDGNYLSVNPALARMYGYNSPEELMAVCDIGQVVYVDPERRKEFKRLIETQGFVELFEYEVYRKDGTKILLCENARAVRNAEGAVMYYEGTVEDITQRKRVEEVERANKAKSEFLSRVSHELRTPLNAILGFGQLLERQKPTEIQRTRIRHIINAGQHLLGLINEVLDISRIEAGKMQVSLEPVCVADALAETIDLMRPLAVERNIKLSADSDLDASVYVLADRQRFKQVLLNLLTNAVKYTPAFGSVAVSYQANTDKNVRICVADTGLGIAPEKLSRLFTPFDRLGAEQSNVEGTGIGLALSQRLMEAMHGLLGLDTEVGKGSTFWVDLPRTKSPLEHASAQKRNGALPPSRVDAAHRKVLYIEDNLSNLTLIEQILAERPEIELLSAIQGKVGLDLARQHSPDLILLDLHLPDLPGWDVLSRLKAAEATSEIPVVVISADATARQIKRLMQSGAATYLTKPLNVAEFFRVLDETTSASNGSDRLSSEQHLTEIDSTI